MKRKILSFLLVFGMFECVIAQTKDGVVSFDVPVKNSLKFNRFLINPAFSYIREDESFVSFLNKRQWMGFEDAPTSYFFSYSGKFRDQNGIGFGIFQRNVGVMTSFGAVANFARNVELNNDSNFTFGLNLAYVNSGLNTSKAFTNEPDASLDNVPKNSLISVNPGINYSTGFIDFGVTANNVFYYNFTNSESVQDDPAKSIAAHAMYTGYFDGYGFLEKARFSALIRGDVAKEKTIFSGSFLFNAPKAGWAQAGYNSVYGASAGIGIILAKKISIGYTVEKGFGNFSDFGLTHEVTLAYKIRGYGEYEDDKPIVRATKKTNPGQTTKAVAVKKKTSAELYKERQEALALKQQQEKERLEAERLRREAALAEAKAKAEEAARLKAEREKELALQGQQNAEARAKALAEAKLKAEQDKAKALADAERLRNEKLAADAKAKSDTAARLKAEQERLAREKAEADRIAREQALADAKAKADEAARLKADQDRIAKERADAAKAEADRLAREKAEADRIAREQALADAKAKADEAARLKAEQDRIAKERADAAKAEADRIAREKAEADRIAREQALADAKAKADEAARLKADQDRIAKERADAAKVEADRLAREKAEADRIAKEQALADAKAKADEAKVEADRVAREKAEADRIAREQALADAKVKADEAARLKAEQDRIAKERADAAKAEADRVAREKAEADRIAREQALADAKEKADEAARLKAEQDRIAKERADAAKVEADRLAREKAEADRIAKEQALSDAKAKADEAARLKAEQDRIAKERADAAKAEVDRIAREKAEADRIAKEQADAKANEEAERLRKEAEEKARLDALKTAEDKEIDNLSGVIEDSKKIQSESINKFKTLVSDKEKELLELRKANDDSDKGIVTQVKEVEFQSGATANRALEALKVDIKENLKQQDQFIKEYETLAAERLKKIPNKNDLVNLNYTKTIEKLKIDRELSERQSNELITKLEQIKVDTEVEKKRRIKKALFDNTQEKFQKDRAALSQIKATTSPTGQVYQPTDFDYGDSDQTNMQIVKNIDNVKPGFYLVVASHKDEARRDAFIKKAIQAGQTNIDFFYDVNTSTYHIYYQEFEEIGEADNAMKTKGTKPFNGKMVILKVEK